MSSASAASVAKANLTDNQIWSLVSAQIMAGIDKSKTECDICCEVFTKQRRKPIVCQACDYVACNACYKTFLTGDGVSRPKCMNEKCNTEWTPTFLKSHFTEAFISGELRDHATMILVQQQIAMLAATQPAVERRIRMVQIRSDIIDIDRQMNDLLIRKRILQQETRILERGGNIGDEVAAVSAFQHKCCASDCLGFVSSAWKCGICEKFSCTHCHEVKGATTEEIDAHVCNPDNVETVKLLKADTKPCPGCGTYIHKTEGCDQMFCIMCKQLWSWNTGRIEERGHNPHYLEWMRSRAGSVLVRDPADIQCGREIDWRFNNIMYSTFREIGLRRIISDDDFEKLRVVSKTWAESIAHLRHHDITAFRASAETRVPLENLRISYMMKQTTENHFRLRVFQIHKNGEVDRQILELLIAMQNAATDILYRFLDTLSTMLSNTDELPLTASKLDSAKNQLLELSELRNYAQHCIVEIYSMNSKTAKHSFKREYSFALTN
jgi:hypothetical protein